MRICRSLCINFFHEIYDHGRFDLSMEKADVGNWLIALAHNEHPTSCGWQLDDHPSLIPCDTLLFSGYQVAMDTAYM